MFGSGNLMKYFTSQILIVPCTVHSNKFRSMHVICMLIFYFVGKMKQLVCNGLNYQLV